MIERIYLRLGVENGTEDALLEELLRSSIDTINLYIKADELPASLETVAVNLTVDAYNRLGTEGTKSETKGTLSQSFYDRCLDPYLDVLDKYIDRQRKRVVFA